MIDGRASNLDAAIRTMEAADEFDGKTRKALERLATVYFWRAVGGRDSHPSRPTQGSSVAEGRA